jgi:phosphate transport system substrate-binding protein
MLMLTPINARLLLKGLLCSAFLSFSLLSHAQATRQNPMQQELRIHGSNTVGQKLAPSLVKAWLKASGWEKIESVSTAPEELLLIASRRGEKLTVNIESHGTSTGFSDLTEGRADIAMASRAPKIEERNRNIVLHRRDLEDVEHVIALDGIAIVVHPQNPLQALDVTQIKAIFSGAISSWNTLNNRRAPIRILARDGKSGTFDAFNTLVLSGASIKADAERFESNAQIAEQVASDVNAIGFLSSAATGKTKVLAVRSGSALALPPTHEHVAIEDYLLTRRLSFFVNDSSNSLVRSFVEFSLTNQGQRIVESLSFVPLQVRPIQVSIHSDAPADYKRFVDGSRRLSLNFRFNNGDTLLDRRAEMDVYRLMEFVSRPENKGGRLRLVGFTDNQMRTEFFAQSMSESWAELVADRLSRTVVRVDGIRGYGMSLPVADNATETGRSSNRRVEVWWVPPQSKIAQTISATETDKVLAN